MYNDSMINVSDVVMLLPYFVQVNKA